MKSPNSHSLPQPTQIERSAFVPVLPYLPISFSLPILPVRLLPKLP